MRQPVVLFKARKDLNTHEIAVARCDRIEQRANRMVTGKLRYAHQGIGIILAFGLLQGG